MVLLLMHPPTTSCPVAVSPHSDYDDDEPVPDLYDDEDDDELAAMDEEFSYSHVDPEFDFVPTDWLVKYIKCPAVSDQTCYRGS